mgnify:FL=1
MQKRIRIPSVCAAIALVLMLVISQNAAAYATDQTYYSYRYNVWNTAVETGQSYIPAGVVSGESLGCGPLKKPESLAVTTSGDVYLLDSGNNRVLVLDENLHLIRILEPVDKDGNPFAFAEPVDIFVNARENRILICDKTRAVLIFDMDLKLTGELKSPDSPILTEGFLYAPVKALMDSAGLYYVISENCYLGALQFDTDGKFIGFFGSEKVTPTFDTLINYFWKQILSDQQISYMKRLVPNDFVSFCIDDRDFIYTVRKGNDVNSGQVKKLNAKGNNILPDKVFGDLGVERNLSRITVDNHGFITVLDSGSNRLFQYDSSGNLLYAFGGKGIQAGLTLEPSSIAALGEDLLVLDRQTGLITRYKPSAFARNIREASALSADGKYQQAMSLWQEVLKRDSSYELANLGMGKAYEGLAEFGLAADYYKKAYDRELYSQAFAEVRSEYLRRHFPLFMIGLAVLILLPVGVVVYSRKRKKSVYDLRLKKSSYPFYCMVHPIIGYSDMKEQKSEDKKIASVILLLFFIVSILNNQLTGFAFNHNRTDQFNLPFTFVSTVGVFIAFVVCNWSITTIMDGKGRLFEIGSYCAYAMLPYILGSLLLIILSNLLTSDETAIIQMIRMVVYGWTGISLVTALKEVHMYSLKKTVWTTVLTLSGMVVVLIVCAISYNIVTQLIEFVGNIAAEIRSF